MNNKEPNKSAQKDYRIMVKDGLKPVMVSIHSVDYPEYLEAGYVVDTIGAKAECSERLYELIEEFNQD